MCKNAPDIIYDEITLLGTPALLTDWRIDRSTVPTDLHLYELRHADEDWGNPCQLAKGILVNFYGSILTAQSIPLPESGYLNFDSKDFLYVADAPCTTISEFLQKYNTKEA